MKKILIMVLMALGMVALTPPTMEVASAVGDTTVCSGINDAELKAAAGCDQGNKTIFPAINELVNMILGVFGIVAVAVMIYGGVTFVASTGETSKITKARNIIIYGLIGLVASLLAIAIVQFVSGSIGS